MKKKQISKRIVEAMKPGVAQDGPRGPTAEHWDVFYAFELKRVAVEIAALTHKARMLKGERERLGEVTKLGRHLIAKLQKAR